MENNVYVTALFYFIYEKQEITKKDIDEYRLFEWLPSDEFNLMTDDFIRSLKAVLNVRGVVVLHRWRTFFDICYKEMLSSHLMYVKFIIFACISEENCINHIFENFLGVCALVKLLCDETLVKTGVNLSILNKYIMRVFYQRRLKINFLKEGGFQRFVEYVRDHRYLKWKLNENSFLLLEDPVAFFNDTQIDLDKKLKKELEKESVFTIDIDLTKIVNNSLCQRVAQIILDRASTNLPPLPNSLELIKCMEAYKRKHMTKNIEEKIAAATDELETMNVPMHGYSSSNSESKTRSMEAYKKKQMMKATEERRAASTQELEAKNVPTHGYSSSKSESKTSYDANNEDNIEWCENIIQAVIRHNRSKCSNNDTLYNKIQEEAEGILKHLKESMESIVEVLTEYDEEC